MEWITIVAVFALAYAWANWDDESPEGKATGINKLPKDGWG